MPFEHLFTVSVLAYPALAILVGLGNIGLPVPERTALLVAGYLLWHGELSLAAVLVSALIGAAAGGYLGYRLGVQLGRLRGWLPRRWATRQPELAARLCERHGALGVFVARLLPGTRLLVNGIAGAARFRALAFLLAVMGAAAVYVPLTLLSGAWVGYRVAEGAATWHHSAVQVSQAMLALSLVGAGLAYLFGRRLALDRERAVTTVD